MLWGCFCAVFFFKSAAEPAGGGVAWQSRLLGTAGEGAGAGTHLGFHQLPGIHPLLFS